MHVVLDNLTPYFFQYGVFALFFLLALGIIGLPIPEESMMIFAGYLVAQGKWGIVSTALAAIFGSIAGISGSYLLGLTAGHYWLAKYGYLVGIDDKKIKKTELWFEGIGKWSLFIGYFILGVRHLTGYIAGSSQLPYKKFALYAYSGAVFWATTFLSIGYFFHEKIGSIAKKITEYDYFAFIIAAIILLGLLWGIRLYRRRRLRTRGNTIK